MLPRIVGAEHGVTEFSVCTIGFQSYFGPELSCYALFLPFVVGTCQCRLGICNFKYYFTGNHSVCLPAVSERQWALGLWNRVRTVKTGSWTACTLYYEVFSGDRGRMLYLNIQCPPWGRVFEHLVSSWSCGLRTLWEFERRDLPDYCRSLGIG